MDTKELREKAYKKLGFGCECCGTTESAFLNIGHRNNDGSISRRLKIAASGHHLYRKVLKMDNPKSLFRLECSNCNQAIRRNGICPHVNATRRDASSAEDDSIDNRR